MSTSKITGRGLKRTFSRMPAQNRKGEYGKRIIRRYTIEGRVYELHATKGWRSYRA